MSKISLKQTLQNALYLAQEYQYGFAAWKSPLSETQNCSIGPVESILNNNVSKSKGFLFHPYDDTASGLFIKSSINISHHKSENSYTTDNNELLDQLLQRNSSTQEYYINKDVVKMEVDQSEFCEYVEKSVEAIKIGKFQKVVPARSQQFDLTNQFDLLDNFNKLCEAYPNAFVSIISVPNAGTWVGATPEILINVHQNTFETVSLAGTQRHNPDMPLSEVAWTQKEIEEQAMVSRYIINCFKKIRLREFEEAGPKTVVAGNLIHLKTTFKVDTQSTDSPDLGETMLDLLHPTSAVCGMPKVPAAKFIRDYENGNRGYYSGYLGPANHENGMQLYVNLRCMQVLEKSAILYAGAGVTEDSIPEKEWLETELKMNTLLNIIKL